MPSISEISVLLEEVEKEYDVFSWRYRNIDLWPLIRAKSILASHSSTGQNKSSRTGGNLKRSIRAIIRSIRLLHYSIRSIELRPVRKNINIIIYSEPSNLYFIGNHYYNRITDPFVSLIDSKEVLVLERKSASTTSFPRKYPVITIAFQLYIMKIIGIIRAKLDKPDLNQLFKDFDAIKSHSRHSIVLVGFQSKQALIREAICIHATMRYLQSILRRYTPKVCVISCYYSSASFPMIVACKNLKIKVADIQHGVISNSHPAYGNWTVKSETPNFNTLPDCFLTWSESERDIINSWTRSLFGEDRAIVIGNLWNELWKIGYFSDNNLVLKLNNLRSGKKNVLVTLQTGLPQYGIPNNLLGILQSCSEKYQFLIRCHPGQRGQLREIGLWLKDHDISDEFLDLASSSPLPALLAVSDLHITVLSSVVIEAAYFGVPSIILATEDLEYFRKEIDSDWAYPFADDSRLEDLVRHILTKKFVKGNSESSADLPTITCRINSIISVILNDAHDKTGANR